MGVFKDEAEYKRVIFNIRQELADRLDQAKAEASELGKKLDYESAINNSLERFLKKAERRIGELKAKRTTKKPKTATNEKSINHANNKEENEHEEK